MRYVIDTLFQLTYHVVIQDRLLVKFCVVKSVKTGVEKISDCRFRISDLRKDWAGTPLAINIFSLKSKI